MNPYDAPMPDRIDRLAKRVDDLEHRLVSLSPSAAASSPPC
jgi:hypothetical protein